MANVGYATMQVIPSLKGMTGEMDKQLSILGYKSSSAGQQAGQSFGKQFTNLAARVVGAWAVGNVVNKTFDFLKSSIIGVNSEIENSTAALAQMLGSNDKAKALVKQFQDLASASATLDIKSASQFGRQLVAMGVPASKAVGTLKSLANAAAGSGTGIDGLGRAVRAFGQISAKGRVQTEELLQLQELGIPAINLLAQGFGKTTAEMQKMVTKGQVPASKALPILQKQLDKFYGDSDKVDTLSEAWDKFKTDVQGAIGSVTAGLFAKLSSSMQKLANSNVVDKVAAGLSTGLGRLTSLLTGINWSPIVGAFKNLGAAVKNLVKLGKSLWAIFGPLILDAFKALVGAFILASGAVKALSGWLAAAGKWLTQYSGWIRPIAVGIVAVVAALKAWALIQQTIIVITKAWAVAQAALNAVMAMNPIGLVVLALIGLAAAFVYAYKHSETFRNVVWAVLHGVQTAAMAVVHFFTGPFVGFFKAIGAWFSGPFAGFFVNAFHTVVNAAVTAWHGIRAAWNAVTGFFAGIGRGIAHGVQAGFDTVMRGARTIERGIRGIADHIVGFFTALPRRIGDIGGTIGRHILDGVRSMWNNTIGGRGIHVGPVNFEIPKLAKGGVVNKPTLALIGEAGPEAVVPLKGRNGKRAARGMGVDGSKGALVENLTINVGADADVRDGLEEVNFQLRRISRGGVYA